MLVTSLIAATAAAKWLVAAKIITTVGTAMVAVSPIVEKMRKEADVQKYTVAEKKN